MQSSSRHDPRLSERTRGGRQSDADMSYGTYHGPDRKGRRGAFLASRPRDLPVHAVSGRHHPLWRHHGAPARVPGAQGHTGLPGPAPRSRGLSADDPGGQGPRPTLCKQRSTGEMVSQKTGGCQHGPNPRGVWPSADSSHLLLLALSLGERMVQVSITHLSVPSGQELTESCHHAYVIRGAPTPHKKPVPREG